MEKNSMKEEIEIIIDKEKSGKDSAFQDPDNLSWGIALIVVGLLFMVDSLGFADLPLYNWWAIFILVPGINMLTKAWFHYRQSGSFTSNASRSGMWGSVLVLVAFTFFFNLSWNLLFPFVLIAAGIYILLGR